MQKDVELKEKIVTYERVIMYRRMQALGRLKRVFDIVLLN